MRPLRVLHLPTNIRWIMDVIIEGQNEIGIETQKFILCGKSFYAPLRDPNGRYRGWPEFVKQLMRFMKKYVSALLWADVVHWQYCTRFWPKESALRKLDFLMLKLLRKPAIAQFHGMDFRRNYDWAIENPLWLEAFSESEMEYFENVAYVTQRDFSEAGLLLAMGYGMLPSVLPENLDRAVLLERSVDIANLSPAFNRASETVVIMHGPSLPQSKGTKYVESAIEEIEKLRKIKFVLLKDMDHDEVVEKLGEADIVIDQLLNGDYGLASIEALARGSAVVTYIADSLKSAYPSSLPIVSATPDTLVDVLLDLIDNPEKRNEIAKQGYAYAYGVHSLESTIPEVLRAYRQAAVERRRYLVVKKIDAALARCRRYKWR